MQSLNRIVKLVKKIEKQKRDLKSSQRQLQDLVRGPKPLATAGIRLIGHNLKVYNIFKENPDQPLTSDEVAHKAGVPRLAVNGALHRLANGGFIVRERRGYYRFQK